MIRNRLGASARGTPRVPPTGGAGAAFYQTLEVNSVAQPQEPVLNLIAGTGITIVNVDDPGVASDVTFTVTGAPPTGPAGGQLSGTYPNPSVVGITESGGPTALSIGAIADGEFLQRSGATVVGAAIFYQTLEVNSVAQAQEPVLNLIGGTNVTIANVDDPGVASDVTISVPSAAPSGAAGGDLSGTYPNPSVAAITETSGPTQLVIGAIADGEFLVRSGATLVGTSIDSDDVTNLSDVPGADVTDALNALLAGMGAVKQFGAPDTDTPNNADWTVNSAAAIAADSNNAALSVMLFDDTTEEGVGMDILVPVDATSINFAFVYRAETAPGAASTVQVSVYARDLPDNAAVPAWSAAIDLFEPSGLPVPTNENWQYDNESVTLATLGVTAGEIAQFEITRQPADPDDNLTGDLAIFAIILTFE